MLEIGAERREEACFLQWLVSAGQKARHSSVWKRTRPSGPD